MSISITLLYDRILVTPIATDTKDYATTVGGVMIPTKNKLTFQEGIIAYQGPGLLRDDGLTYKPMHTKVGDRIRFGKKVGIPFVVENNTFILLREVEVWCILQDTI